MGYNKFLIRTVVSVSLMIWLLSKVDLSQIGDQWQKINWLLLVLVIPPIHMLCIALRSLRLKMILSGMGLGISVSWLSLAQLKSLFVGAILPGGISGDVYRSYLVSKTTGQAFESIAAVLVEKCVGIGSMLFMFIVGLLWGSVFVGHPVFVDLERSLRFVWVGLLLAAIIFCATLFYSGQAQTAGTPFNYTGKLRACLSHVLGFFANSGHLLEMAIFSFLIQIAVVAWYFIISISMHFETSIFVLMLTVPLIEFLLMLPISISGLGVREMAFVILMAPFGLTVAEAVSFSLLSFAVSTATRALSGAAFLLKPVMQEHHA